ncbi:MAG: glycosyltransferase family 2 protein [Candidatus Omnitrophica bacterium]|nr:glycosyltransferase family 2 protein [Candidatus Omnitrophota bacterium]
MEFLFWISNAFIIYTYAGYPALLFVIAKLFPAPAVMKADIRPKVTILIAAHNEEKCIKKTIENKLSLDYPQDKIEIRVVSDASVDMTNEIVSGFKNKGVVLDVIKNRGGKLNAINKGAAKAKGEIIVFCDANTIFKKDNLQKLTRNFNDKNVVCVNGEKRMLSARNMGGPGEGFYWTYESFIRTYESLSCGGLIAVDGSNFAVRKSVYPFPAVEAVGADVAIVWELLKRGHKSVYEPQAIAFEEPCADIKDEFKRKSRIISTGYNAVRKNKVLLNPFRSKESCLQSWKILSHRFLKWQVPYFLIVLFISNIFLTPISGYRYLLFLQILFYVGSVVGYILYKNNVNSKFFLILLSVVLGNAAAVAGLMKFLTGRSEIIWRSPAR